jgi:hypothetical protein
MSQSCTYNGQTYSHGSIVCQSGYEYHCNDGNWDALNTKCSEGDGELITNVTTSGKTESADLKDPRNSSDPTEQP